MITFKLVTKMFSDSNQNHCHKFITIINKRTLHLDLKKGNKNFNCFGEIKKFIITETTGSLIFLCTGWNFFIISTVHKCEEYGLCPQTEQDTCMLELLT